MLSTFSNMYANNGDLNYRNRSLYVAWNVLVNLYLQLLLLNEVTSEEIDEYFGRISLVLKRKKYSYPTIKSFVFVYRATILKRAFLAHFLLHMTSVNIEKSVNGGRIMRKADSMNLIYLPLINNSVGDLAWKNVQNFCGANVIRQWGNARGCPSTSLAQILVTINTWLMRLFIARALYCGRGNIYRGLSYTNLTLYIAFKRDTYYLQDM